MPPKRPPVTERELRRAEREGAERQELAQLIRDAIALLRSTSATTR